MNNERLKGAAQKFKGSLKRAVGKLVGNKRLETEGKVDEAAGTVRKAVGEAKIAGGDAPKDAR